MKSNIEKSKLLLCEEGENHIDIDKKIVTSSPAVRILGVTVDRKLNFQEHVRSICKNASRKIHALGRVKKYMHSSKLKLIMHSFIEEFNYCPLIWMFHNRTLNRRINKLHERVLRITYKDETSSYETLLSINNNFTTHERNLPKLATLMYKVKNNISPIIVNNLFKKHHTQYHMRTDRS